MRVLFVAEYFPLCPAGAFEITGGVESVALGSAQWLAQNHDVRAVTNYRCGPAAMRVGRLEVVQCGHHGRYTQKGGLLGRASFQREAIARGVEFRPDVVVGWNFVSYAPAYRIARRCGVPAVAWYADVWVGRWLRLFGLAGILGELLERRVLRQHWDHFIAISDWTRSLLQARGIKPTDIAIIPPIVDVPANLMSERVKQTDRSVDEMELVTVSRLVTYKRVDVLISAFARLAARWPSLRLTVIGAGAEKRRLERLAAREGVAGRIQWRGWLREHSEVLSVVAAAALYASASEVEGFGIATVEAAALGVPYVVADIPAVRFATRGGQGGFLFPPGNVRACAEAMERLLKDRDLRKRKGTEGRELAQLYRPEVIGPQFEDVLKSLV